MDEPTGPKRTPRGAWKLASVGTELAAAVGGFCLLGWWIDRRYDTGPWGLVICAVIGIVGGLYNLIRKAVLESVESTRETRRRGEQASSEHRKPEE